MISVQEGELIVETNSGDEASVPAALEHTPTEPAESPDGADRGTAVGDRGGPDSTGPDAGRGEGASTADADAQRNEKGQFQKSGKPRSDPNARIKQAVDRQHEAEARYAAAEERLARLEADFQAWRRPEPTQAPAPDRPAVPSPAAGRPEPTENEIGSKYASYADFVKDQNQWLHEQRMAAGFPPEVIQQIYDQVRQQFEHDTILAEFDDRAKAFREAHPDYDQKIADADTLLAQHGIGMPQMVADAVMRSKNSAAVVYWLTTHPTEYLQLARETAGFPVVAENSDPATRQAFATASALMRRHLEGLATAASSNGSAAPPIVSQAKPPIKPVGSSPIHVPDEGSDDESFETFYKRESKRFQR